MSCSDQNLDTVIELAKHAQAIGADYIVVHAPVLHFLPATTRRCSTTTAPSPSRSTSALRCGAIPTAAIS